VALRLAMSFLCHQSEYICIDNCLNQNLQNFDNSQNFLRFTLVFILLVFVFAAYGQQITVAVLPSEGAVLSSDELEVLTFEIRNAALKVLPLKDFFLHPEEAVIKRLGGAENFVKECMESSCIVELGKKANVDYVAKAYVNKLGNNLKLRVELFDVNLENLVGQCCEDYAENAKGLIDNIAKKQVPAVFSKIPGALRASSRIDINPGISGLQKPVDDYDIDHEKHYVVNLSTEPPGAVLSFDGVPSASCAKTPCKAELREGYVRIIAALEQYETADTTISIKHNNQNIAITLKPKFGILEIRPAYLEGISNGKQWNLSINDNPYSLGEIWLFPNKYAVKLRHECYENIDFDVGINKGRREVFDMAGNIILKKGGLVLSAERDGEPASESVFVNGKPAGETPFSGSVPLCAKVEILDGKEMVEVDVNLKYKKEVRHTHRLYVNETKSSTDATVRAEKEEVIWTAWMVGVVALLGASVSLNLNDVDPNYFKSSGFQWNPLNIEFYKRNLRFFRFGMNLGFGAISVDEDAVRKMQPNVLIDSMETHHFKINAFARLYPANFLFLSGGVGLDYFGIMAKGIKPGTADLTDIAVVNIFTPIFPIGGGMFLNFSSDKNSESGLVIEALYNIVPFKGRTAAYISINAGYRINFGIRQPTKPKGDIK